MNILRAICASMLAVVVGCARLDSASAPRPEHVLVDVTVIDGPGTQAKPGRTIEITNGRIAAIRPTVPGNSATLDVAGSFVIPGLIDAHVHLPADRALLEGARDGHPDL